MFVEKRKRKKDNLQLAFVFGGNMIYTDKVISKRSSCARIQLHIECNYRAAELFLTSQKNKKKKTQRSEESCEMIIRCCTVFPFFAIEIPSSLAGFFLIQSNKFRALLP